MRLVIVLEGRAVPWARAGQAGARKFTPAKMAACQRAIATLARVQMKSAGPATGPLRLQVTAVYDTPAGWTPAQREQGIAGGYHTSTPDADNLGKLVGDALNGVAYMDDSQIAENLIRKRYGTMERTEIILTAIGLEQEPLPATLRRDAKWAAIAGPLSIPADRAARIEARSKL